MNRLTYVGAVCIAAFFPLTDSDIWWQWAAGKQMFAQGSLLFADPFTFTTYGASWNNVHWLYQLWIACVGDPFGLVLLHSVLWGAAAWAWLPPRANSAWLLILGVPILWANHYLLLARPLALSLLLLGLQARLYCSAGLSRRRWGGILFLQVLLANVQGLFLLGPLFWCGYAWYMRKTWRILICGAGAMLAASCVHPAGPVILLYPWRLLERISPGNAFAQGITENSSPLWSLASFEGASSLQAWSLVALTLGIGYLTGKRVLPLRLIILWTPLLLLSWLAERNIPITLLIIWPVVANALPSLAKPWSRVGFAVFLAMAISQWQWWQFGGGPVSPFRFPERTTHFLHSQLSSTSSSPKYIFCDDHHGGYLSLHLFPRVQTLLDGRFILRDEGFFLDYLSAHQDRSAFNRLLGGQPIDYILLPIAYPGRWGRLAQELAQDSSWRLVFLDETAWLFERKDGVHSPLDRDSLRLEFAHRSRDWPAERRQEAAFWLESALHRVSYIWQYRHAHLVSNP